MSSLKLGKLPHQLGIVGQMRQLGMKKSQNKFLFSKLKTAGKNISKSFKIVVLLFICLIVPTSFKVFAAIIRISSEKGAFGGSLRCNKF